ncbi:hypothetical protein, partial [Microbispora triticiradicis]|uniref:hypothetical protein n=1 Tax=Microbispora triticiradicis TaxID=2200763 RepID=UPI001AD64450
MQIEVTNDPVRGKNQAPARECPADAVRRVRVPDTTEVARRPSFAVPRACAGTARVQEPLVLPIPANELNGSGTLGPYWT